jgi:hypothetical protein
LSKLHPGHPVVCWVQEYEDQGEAQPYEKKHSRWSEWFLDHVARNTRRIAR